MAGEWTEAHGVARHAERTAHRTLTNDFRPAPKLLFSLLFSSPNAKKKRERYSHSSSKKNHKRKGGNIRKRKKVYYVSVRPPPELDATWFAGQKLLSKDFFSSETQVGSSCDHRRARTIYPFPKSIGRHSSVVRPYLFSPGGRNKLALMGRGISSSAHIVFRPTYTTCNQLWDSNWVQHSLAVETTSIRGMISSLAKSNAPLFDSIWLYQPAANKMGGVPRGPSAICRERERAIRGRESCWSATRPSRDKSCTRASDSRL